MSEAKEKEPAMTFVEDVEKPVTERVVGSGNVSSGLKRSFFEDDVVNGDVYTCTVSMGDVKFYAREFTRDELKAFRSAAKRVALDMGLSEELVYDADAFNKALAALPVDADGNGGVEQYAQRMAETFNDVIVKHLRGWDFPHPCTTEKKLKLWPSNKFEFCMNLSQLGGLSGREASELKNS